VKHETDRSVLPDAVLNVLKDFGSQGAAAEARAGAQFAVIDADVF